MNREKRSVPRPPARSSWPFPRLLQVMKEHGPIDLGDVESALKKFLLEMRQRGAARRLSALFRRRPFRGNRRGSRWLAKSTSSRRGSLKFWPIWSE